MTSAPSPLDHLHAARHALAELARTRGRDTLLARRLGLTPQAAAACQGARHAADDAGARCRALTLLVDATCPSRTLPRTVRSPLDGEAIPVHIQRCDAVPRLQSSLLAWNRSNKRGNGALGAILRLLDEPQRLLALTAGHVCGAAPGVRRGDTMHFEARDDGALWFEGPLLDWQPNFARMDERCDIDAGIAEVQPEDLAALHAQRDLWPTGSAPLFGDDALRLRAPGRDIAGRGFELCSVTLRAAHDDSRAYVLGEGIDWQCSELTVGGDSGAPLWNARDELVAIHAGGAVIDGVAHAYAVPIGPILQWVGASVVRRGDPLRRPAAVSGRRLGPSPAGDGIAPHAVSPDDEAIDVLARTMYGEARGEGRAGMEAVAHVVCNRVDAARWWGGSVIEVCRKPWQFSCWNANDPNRRRLLEVSAADASFALAVDIAARVHAAHRKADGSRARLDTTEGATHYYAPARVRRPRWAQGLVPCARIGGHDFFTGVA
ncbi:cell wall hydrolase [Aquabacterium humicola]|uniref:cell wall hydrolase n=1 Tax=Aquabacterium humicola TaxID=3237377 RepID=UPI002543A7CD|nr:cell wall hydrolase [Rubrivivax pictus]